METMEPGTTLEVWGDSVVSDADFPGLFYILTSLGQG